MIHAGFMNAWVLTKGCVGVLHLYSKQAIKAKQSLLPLYHPSLIHLFISFERGQVLPLALSELSHQILKTLLGCLARISLLFQWGKCAQSGYIIPHPVTQLMMCNLLEPELVQFC